MSKDGTEMYEVWLREPGRITRLYPGELLSQKEVDQIRKVTKKGTKVITILHTKERDANNSF